MYISGVKVNDTNVEAVIRQLIAMPDKGFKERTRKIADAQEMMTPNPFLSQLVHGLIMHPANQKLNFQMHPQMLIVQLGRFVEQTKGHDKFCIARLYAMAAIGKLQLYMGEYDTAITTLYDIVKESIAHNQHAVSHRLSGILHATLCHIFRENKVSEANRERYKYILAESRDICRAEYLNYSGKPLNRDSWLVAQDEIGLALVDEIGTYSVQQCVAVIVQHPITKKVALAHVSLKTAQADPLEHLFKVLGGKTETDPPYKVKLVGATYDKNGPNRELSLRIGHFNLTAVTKSLLRRDVDIQSAWVMEADIPNSFSVNCAAFDEGLREDIPLRGYKRAELSACIVTEPDLKKPDKTITCFDLTKHYGELPLLVPKAYVIRLRQEILNLDDVQIEALIKSEQTHYSPYHVTRTVGATIDLRDEYKTAYSGLLTTFNEAVAALPANVILMESAMASLLKKLELCPLHVGENHEIANQPLVDFIKTKLFKVTGTSLSIDSQGLEKFEFKEATIDIIARHFGETHQGAAQRTGSILDKTG